MATTYKELYQKVLLRLESTDGKALLASKESINDAQKVIARVQDFDELKVLDTSNALTVASTKTYHLTDDWGLTRPKDLYYLKYMDEGSSRKLTYVPPRTVAESLPYEEILGEEKPKWYARRGNNIDLIPIPSEAKSIYIYYSQWPTILDSDTDETDYVDIDDVIIALGTEMADAILQGVTGTNWSGRAGALLKGSVMEDAYRPDQDYYAQPFRASRESAPLGEYWKMPFVKKAP